MLRSSLSLLVASAFVVVGCPVYDDGCVDDSDCGSGYVCHAPSRECVSSEDPNAALRRCAAPNDCDASETCDRFGRCRTETCGAVGCISGYRCEVQDGFEHCMRSQGAGGSSGSAGRAGGAQSGDAGEAGAPSQGGGAGG